MPDDYEVGFGKPPKRTQFKKGTSGNPKGRPKGSPNTATLLDRILSEHTAVREGNQERRISKLEVMLRVLVNKACKGDARAIQLLLKTQTPGESAPSGPTGVLVVPGMLDEEEWARRADIQQAPYRGNTGDKPT